MHILIIEDEEETRREMTDFLENSLHRVTAFTEFEHIIPQIFAIRPDFPFCTGAAGMCHSHDVQ